MTVSIQKIALYLSGLLPGYYRMPNKLQIIFAMRSLYNGIPSNDILSLLKEVGDIEYYSSLLYFAYNESKTIFIDLLRQLEVPEPLFVDIISSGDTAPMCVLSFLSKGIRDKVHSLGGTYEIKLCSDSIDFIIK